MLKYVCVYMQACVYIYLLMRMSRIQHQVNFQMKFNRFEFRVFLLLD